jgi:hypothetical protein
MMRLKDIAHGRSGDKGDHANIGIIAYTQAGHAYLERELTAEKVRDWFHALGPSRVERFDLPKLYAFNFLLRDVLGGGASDSLRTDTQGKVLATALLEMPMPEPGNIAAMQPAAGHGAERGAVRGAERGAERGVGSRGSGREAA